VGQLTGVLKRHAKIAHIDQLTASGANGEVSSFTFGRPPGRLADDLGISFVVHVSGTTAALHLLQWQRRSKHGR